MDDYASLLVRDQLTQQRALNLVFGDFREGAIRFPPTFKVRTLRALYWSPAC